MKTGSLKSATSAGDAGAWSRREFLQRAVGVGAGFALGSRPAQAAPGDDTPLPTRVLGRTGARVTILGLGTAPIGEARVEVPKAARIFAEVIDRGVNYDDFEGKVMPECRQRNVGVVAMKDRCPESRYLKVLGARVR